MLGEDHTLGNSFRYILSKNHKVDFVGYSIPHPSEMKLNMRIQTKDGHAVSDVIVESSQTLADICDHVKDTFEQAEELYTQQHPKGAEQQAMEE